MFVGCWYFIRLFVYLGCCLLFALLGCWVLIVAVRFVNIYFNLVTWESYLCWVLLLACLVWFV